MKGNVAEMVRAAILDPDPALKSATDPRWKFLIRRVRVFLDAEDVTDRCKAFSIPGRTVELYAEDERGRKVLSASCACGTITNQEKRAARNYNPACPVCGKKYRWDALTEVKIGRVDVVPVSSFSPSSEEPKEEEGAA